MNIHMLLKRISFMHEILRDQIFLAQTFTESVQV